MRPTLPILLLLLPLLPSASAVADELDDVWFVVCEESPDPHEPSTPTNQCNGAYTVFADGKVCYVETVTYGTRHDVCYAVL